MKAKYIKEPGFMYDLFFLFTVFFNYDESLELFSNPNKMPEEKLYYTKLADQLDSIPEPLYSFFYLKDRTKNFMSKFYFEKCASMFGTTYCIDTIQKALTDYEQVKRDLIRFYFDTLSEDALNKCMNSLPAIGVLIRDSCYGDRLKSSLYAFILDPIGITQKLSYELMVRAFKLSQLYNERSDTIIELQSNLELEELLVSLSTSTDYEVSLTSYDAIFVSWCVIHKNCIKTMVVNQSMFILLGQEYGDIVSYLVNTNNGITLDTVGNALAEGNRIEILELIRKKEEVSIKDVEQELGLSSTNAYYHLNLMIKSGLVKSRNQGRTVYYCINRQGFDTVRALLSKYGSQ